MLGSVRHIGERGARKAVLAALTARADGQPSEMPAEYHEWFEQAVAEQTVDDGALRGLADARVAVLRTQLASEQGVDPGRLVVDDPRLDDAAARPTVAVGLGAPPARTASTRPTEAAPAEPAKAPGGTAKPAAPSPTPGTPRRTSPKRHP